jgi:hypothetical protein
MNVHTGCAPVELPYKNGQIMASISAVESMLSIGIRSLAVVARDRKRERNVRRGGARHRPIPVSSIMP